MAFKRNAKRNDSSDPTMALLSGTDAMLAAAQQRTDMMRREMDSTSKIIDMYGSL